ncbi:hypothetical protein CEXT_716301 [Caerostris extrusa]|uniref:Uncharacterized protein n=1 Tax=Caerostris extrusa TaxID=172846 RepID=A0AAV4R8W2_CAEEX|nr:hypothetical protein CEXT_716301 [Caerostris extrusa]
MKGDRREVGSDARFPPADYFDLGKKAKTRTSVLPLLWGLFGKSPISWWGGGWKRNKIDPYRQDVRADILQSGEK